MKKNTLIVSLFICLVSTPAELMAYKGAAGKNFPPDHTETYKKFGEQDFKLHFFYPNYQKPTKPTPAIAMFHGGGFSKGSPNAFYYLCHYLASRGMVGISVQYRLNNDKVGAVMDGRTALRYIYKNADKYGIDKNKIAAGGGSAGGCLAAALSTSTLIHDKTDDMSIPGYPKALVLFNPVYTWKAGKGSPEMRNNFTPSENIHADMAPTLVLVGDNDKFLSVQVAKTFQDNMKKVGVRSDLEIYPGATHAFFTKSQEYVVDTLTKVDIFLTALGFLSGEPTVEQWHDQNKPNKKAKKKTQ
ncbi:hypothetical protein BVX97_03630 [bacterium E08(2017)]|nr:hypothetical protein BVX97_03630 [bacterium E08(2017)]